MNFCVNALKRLISLLGQFLRFSDLENLNGFSLKLCILEPSATLDPHIGG